MTRSIGTILLLAFVAIGSAALENEHEELGSIRWLRDYETALGRAAQTGKPVLILFQEVPGCATCRNYGLQVLSHPLLAEAAEELFVPLAVFNNRTGEDAEVLRLFQEPSWNNPVVRIIDPGGRELTRRLAGDYSPGGFSAAMIAALEAHGNAVPRYLEIAHAELSARGTMATALLSMFCFWQGEIELGAISGVIATRAGYINGSEVVEVSYDAQRLSYEQLLRRAAGLRCADRAFPLSAEQRKAAVRVLGPSRVAAPSGFHADKNTKYYLSRTAYRFLPMTETQRVLANIAVAQGADPLEVLSPRQLAVLRFIHSHPGEPWQDLLLSDDFKGDWQKAWDHSGGNR